MSISGGGVGKTCMPHSPSLPSFLLTLNEIDAQDMGAYERYDPQLIECSAYHTVPIS
jgi:hypothetical protein